MKAIKIILNVLGIIASVFLSILLALFLILAPIVSTVDTFVDPNAALSSMKLDEIVSIEGTDLEETLVERGLSPEIAKDVMKTDAVADVIELYIKDITASLQGDFDTDHMTGDAIRTVVNENIDELIEIAYDNIIEDENHEREEVKQKIISAVDEHADDIAEALPRLEKETVEGMDPSVRSLLVLALSGDLMLYFWIIIAAVSLLLVICRFPRFKGFMWLTVVYFIGGGFALTLGFVLKGFVMSIISRTLEGYESFASPVVNILYKGFSSVGIILVVCAIVFLATFIVGRKVLFAIKRKKAAAVLSSEIKEDDQPVSVGE